MPRRVGARRGCRTGRRLLLGPLGVFGNQAVEVGNGGLLLGLHAGQGGPLFGQLVVQAA